jgi:hypothetical protein
VLPVIRLKVFAAGRLLDDEVDAFMRSSMVEAAGTVAVDRG